MVQNTALTTFLTRAGSFVPDSQGNLVNSAGLQLMGYNVQNGPPTVTANGFNGLQPVNINQMTLQAEPSTQATVNANLDPSATALAAPAGPAAGPVQTASVPSDEPAAPVQQATTLPTRPLVIQTASAEPRPLPPLIPVVSDQFDSKPSPPSLTGPAPKTDGKKPIITIGFDAGL